MPACCEIKGEVYPGAAPVTEASSLAAALSLNGSRRPELLLAVGSVLQWAWRAELYCDSSSGPHQQREHELPGRHLHTSNPLMVCVQCVQHRAGHPTSSTYLLQAVQSLVVAQPNFVKWAPRQNGHIAIKATV